MTKLIFLKWLMHWCYKSEVAQSCLTLWDPVDCSLPGSSIHGTVQARLLEWVAISFSNAWKWKVKVKWLSPVGFLETAWTVAYQAPPSMGLSRHEYWSGVPFPFTTSATLSANPLGWPSLHLPCNSSLKRNSHPGKIPIFQRAGQC